MLLSAIWIGAQALLLAGVHKDVAGTQYGAGGGAFVEVTARAKRLQVHFEGFPVVSIPQRASAYYGQATPAIGILDYSVGYAVTPRIRVGLGQTVINQRTPLPNLSQVVTSRLAGARYELGYSQPLHRNRFIEALFAGSTNLTGADVYVYSDGVTPTVVKQERASAIDGTIELGFVHPKSEFLIGVRVINFSAKYTATNEAGDRNAGVGLVLEWRRRVGGSSP